MKTACKINFNVEKSLLTPNFCLNRVDNQRGTHITGHDLESSSTSGESSLTINSIGLDLLSDWAAIISSGLVGSKNNILRRFFIKDHRAAGPEPEIGHCVLVNLPVTYMQGKNTQIY